MNNESPTTPNTTTTSDTSNSVDPNDESHNESAFKPLLIIVIPFLLVLAYGALGS